MSKYLVMKAIPLRDFLRKYGLSGQKVNYSHSGCEDSSIRIPIKYVQENYTLNFDLPKV